MLFWTPLSEGWKFFAKQASTYGGCTGGDSAALQERTSIGTLREYFPCFFHWIVLFLFLI
jgi:hypothetical protein